MKEHPILFSASMVKAILGDHKTQTRRVLTIQPLDILPMNIPNEWVCLMQKEPESKGKVFRCRYGIPGDRLWVRETFVLEQWEDEPKPPADRPLFHHESDQMDEYDNEYWLWPHYKATDPAPELCYEDDPNDDGEPKCKWRPSIHMPRWASRIALEIISVRIERLQDIGKDENINDVFEEGLSKHAYYEFVDDEPCDINTEEALEDYKELWNSINEKRGFGWDVNPWVWVIEFKRVK